MNAKLLKSKMVLTGDEDFVNTIANLIHVTRQTATAKLNGKSEFTQKEIMIISTHYGFTDEEIRKTFFEGEDINESKRSG